MTNLVAADIERAADAVRSANHATSRGTLDGSETGAVVANLAELVHRLLPVLDFLARSMRRAEPRQYLDDRGTDPAVALCLAHGALADARGLVDDVAGFLDQAHNHLGHLGRLHSED